MDRMMIMMKMLIMMVMVMVMVMRMRRPCETERQIDGGEEEAEKRENSSFHSTFLLHLSH